MKMKLRLIGLALMLLALAACAPADVTSPNDVKSLLENGALLVDVRSKGEFDSGHLDGALNIPHTEVEARLVEFGADKSKPIVVYCRSGNRSGMAKDVLTSNGFTSVYNGGGYGSLKSGGVK